MTDRADDARRQSATDRSGVLDHDTLQDLHATLGPKFPAIAADAIDVMQRYLNDCVGHLHRGDLNEIARTAHRLRGGAAMIGAPAVVAAAAKLEAAAAQTHRAELPSEADGRVPGAGAETDPALGLLVIRLQTTLAQTTKELSDYLHTRGTA